MNNSITIVGHVGQNPTTKTFLSGKKVVKFSVAVKEYQTTQEEPGPIWFDVQAWNGLGDRVISHITKGREVVIQGRLVLHQYQDKEGLLCIKPIINLSGYHLCGPKPSTNSSEGKIEPETSTRKTKMESAK